MGIICNGINYECYDKIDFIDIGVIGLDIPV